MSQHSTILIVDDHPTNVAILEEILGDQYALKTATCGEEALTIAPDFQPDLVLLDIMMPGLDGYETCRRLRTSAALAHTKIIMVSAKGLVAERLQGYEAGADDYITKPFDADELAAKVRVYLRLKAAEDAERALLEHTLHGSVKVLTDLLALVNPVAFGQAVRLKRYVGHIATAFALPDRWQFEVAALLSLLGCVTLPAETLEKVYAGHPLSPEEQHQFAAHPAAGHDLLCHIPRLEAVAGIIARQHEPCAHRAAQGEPRQEDPVILGAQLLKIARDFDQLLTRGLSPRQAVLALQQHPDVYDLRLVAPLKDFEVGAHDAVVRMVRVRDLCPGMMLSEDVRTATGILVLAKGHEVTYAMVQRLRSYAKNVQLLEPFQVQMTLSQ